MSGCYKILVHSIPSDLSKSDFGDLFLNYDNVLTMYVDESNVLLSSEERNRSGYVIFSSKRECYRAISELNGQPPHFLHLQFSTSSNESKEINFQAKVNDTECPSRPNTPWKQNCNISLYNEDEISQSSNTLSVPSLLKNDFSFKCRACHKVSLKSCSNCGVLYCSKFCQIRDWSRHRNECSQLECYPPIYETDNLHINEINGAVCDTKTVGYTEKIQRVFKGNYSDPKLELMQGDKVEQRCTEMHQEDSNQVKNCLEFNKEKKGKNIPNKKGRRYLKSSVVNPKSTNNDCHGDDLLIGAKVNEDCISGRALEKIVEKNIHGSDKKGIFQENSSDVKLANDRKDVCDISCTPMHSRELHSVEESNPIILPVHSSISSPKTSKKEMTKSSTKTEQKKPDQNETKENKLSSLPAHWDLLSDNPKKQIINYDLCTQQKKLSSEKFSKVTINVSVAPNEYWVHCDSDIEEYKMIMRLMIQKTRSSEKPYTPVVGNYCSVLYEKIAYRAKVLSVKETAAESLLIDLGNILCVDFKDMNELPHLAKNYYAHAIHVKLDPFTPKEYLNLPEDTKLSLKAVGLANGGITKVQVEGVVYAQILPMPKLAPPSTAEDTEKMEANSKSNEVKINWPPSILGILKEGQTADCTVLSVHLNDDEKDEFVIAIAFGDIVTDLKNVLNKFPQDCQNLPEDPNFSPSVGDLLAAYYETEGSWVRAVVLGVGVGSWLVACCDLGIITLVKEVRNIPSEKNYCDIPSITAKCHVVSSNLPRDDLFSDERIKEKAALNILVGKRKGDSITCTIGIIEGQHFCTVSLEVWAPTADEPIGTKTTNYPALEYVPLKSGSLVKIVSFYLSMVLYVQPCDIPSKKKLEELQNVILEYIDKSMPLKEIPEVGQMCICMFSGDMQHYRVVINKVKSKEKIHVTFIDFGNDEEVSLEKLYDIPSQLKKIPCFGIKIGLKKDFEKPLTKEANNFLSSLILGNTELTLVRPKGNLRNCELIMSKGTLVNDILKKLVDPPKSGI